MLANGSAWSSLVRTISHGCGPMRGGWMFIARVSLLRSQSRKAEGVRRDHGLAPGWPAFARLDGRLAMEAASVLAVADRDWPTSGSDRLLGQFRVAHLLHGRNLALFQIAVLEAVLDRPGRALGVEPRVHRPDAILGL